MDDSRLNSKAMCDRKIHAFQKSMAQRFGGIAILSRYLAEDFMAGEATRKLGLKVQSNRRPIQQILDEHYTVKDFGTATFAGAECENLRPLCFYGEALTSSLTCGTVLAYASDMSITLVLFHFATWWVVILIQNEMAVA